ncbi:MAG: class I SAM-dependent RNA methyltransferase [Bacteriovoracaceae bacterium]
MRQNRPITFNISSLDSLGQGVSKTGERITFIPKTLPGEEGEAIILAEKKGVAFGRSTSLKVRSPERIEPACIHFDKCPSCHYLHTTYERELAAKEENFRKLFRNLPLPDLKIISAPDRMGYRNRIQLHYDTKKKKIGMLDSRTSEIIPVPQCLIGESSVLEKLKELYQNDLWLKIAPKNPDRGHVEIYRKGETVELNWNKDYAQGGFTQVYELMNERLKDELKSWWGQGKQTVLDLFAGNGNLTDRLPYSGRLCVDIYTQPKSSEFLSQSLYEKNALQSVMRALEKKNLSPEILVLDPPRSGLTDLADWMEKIRPARTAYVSCDPHTLVRDLQKVRGHRLTGAVLLDFFPSTFHFESLIFLERE